MASYDWTVTQVEPADILDALKTIATGASLRSSLHPTDWVPAESYLEWAEAATDTPGGWDIKLTYAKRAVCRRIDGLLANHYLGSRDGRKYPQKIALLRSVHVPVRGVVHDWVIDPRNELEHGYRAADCQQAKTAVDIAGLFLDATADFAEYRPPVLVGTPFSIQHGPGTLNHLTQADAERLTLMEVGEHPFILYDVDDRPYRVKVIHPVALEVQWAGVDQFTDEELVLFALDMQERGDPFITCTQDMAFQPAGAFTQLRQVKARLRLPGAT